ncbi:MAG: acyl--CoA ligase, partial [Lachnospiraceae bacterium]|nr:acyl--CoA ligase [Lachnospiraceae bacterium]
MDNDFLKSDNIIAKQFFETAERYKDKRAIWCDGDEMTYGELSDFVCRYSTYLKDNGVKHGDIIGVPMNNSVGSVALMLASASLGAGLCPINPTLPMESIEAAFDSAKVKHIVARRSFYKNFNDNRDKFDGLRLCLDGEVTGTDSFEKVEKAEPLMPDLNGITGEETWILTMTSGSTGDPKPIELTQNNKLKRIKAHIDLYGITENDRVLAATPLYHSLAERLVILPLMIGAETVLLPRFTPNLWLKCVQDQEVTFTIAVSAQLGQIAQLLSSPLAPSITSMRAVVSSSALLEPHVRRELIEKLKCDFHEMYGASEISTATSINFREALNKQQSVGRAIPEAEIMILGDGDVPLKAGEIGEIACKTELIFKGYYRQEENTLKAFTEDGFFKTGDLGKLDEEGYLYFCGRKKDLIITGGINVYPNDIEKALYKLDKIEECAAFSYPDDRLGEVVALAVVVKKDSELTKRDIQVYCVRNLADFQQPHYIFITEELPKNPMGKLMRGKIYEMIKE